MGRGVLQRWFRRERDAVESEWMHGKGVEDSLIDIMHEREIPRKIDCVECYEVMTLF